MNSIDDLLSSDDCVPSSDMEQVHDKLKKKNVVIDQNDHLELFSPGRMNIDIFTIFYSNFHRIRFVEKNR